MDRRRFIKLTAITGTSATLASCGNPENQIIRFMPDEEIWSRASRCGSRACARCARAGCGVMARVMDGDAEVFRNGQPGVIAWGWRRSSKATRSTPISQGKLCARGQAAIQVTYHPDRIAHAAEAHAASAAAAQFSDDLVGRGDRRAGRAARRAGRASGRAVARVPDPAAARPPARARRASSCAASARRRRWPSSSSATTCCAAPTR